MTQDTELGWCLFSHKRQLENHKDLLSSSQIHRRLQRVPLEHPRKTPQRKFFISSPASPRLWQILQSS